MLERGEKLFTEGRLEEAESCFLSIGERDPGYPEACNNLGVIAFQRGRLEEAVACFSRALAGDLFHREALLNLADALKALGRLSGIIPSLEAFHRRDPGDDEIARLLEEAKKPLPLVSVHMIVWNGEKYIAEAIESVLGQTYRNFELVIVDDGSTDRTREIIEGFKSDRIRYAWKEHSGVAPTRNRARSLCRGDYIAFLDADDVYELRMLEIEVQTLLDHPDIDVVYTNLNIIDEKGKETGVACTYGDHRPGEIVAETFREGHNIVPFGSMMLRREISDRVGEFDERFSISEDSDYIVRIARQGRFRHINEGLYRCRRHGTNLTHDLTGRRKRAAGTFLLLSKMLDHFSREELFPEVRWQELSADQAEAAFHHRLGTIFWNHCQGYFHGGGYENFLNKAGESLRRCLTLDPNHGEARELAGKIHFISSLGKRNGRKPEDPGRPERPPDEICQKLIEAGWHFVDGRRLDEAEASFAMIMEMKWLPMPLGMEALLGLGKTQWLKGNSDQAKRYYSKALQFLNSFEHNACLSNLRFTTDAAPERSYDA